MKNLLTSEELVKFLVGSLQGEASEKAVIMAETVVKMYKKNNPFADKVTKVYSFEAFLKFDYAWELKKERQKAGLEMRAINQADWKERIENSPIIRNKKSGQLYLECEVSKYKGDAKYFFEGREIEKSEFENYLKPTTPKKAGEVNNYRLLKLENIKAISIRNKLKAVLN